MTGMDETSAGPGAVRLVHDDDRDRFEALDGEAVIAVLAHEDEAPVADGARPVRDLRSTVVAPEHGGRGIGSSIVRFALDHTREQGMSVRATCWFVAGWIQRHPEYQDLLETPPTPGTEEEG